MSKYLPAYMDHIILFGGIDSSGKLSAETRKFDQDKWTDGLIKLPSYLHKNMPTPLTYASIGRFGGAAIVCGGVDGISPWSVTNKCWTLSSDYTHWKALPSMLKQRAKAAHYSNGQIFIVAGGEDGKGAAMKTAEKFSDGKWTLISDLPVATKGYRAFY